LEPQKSGDDILFRPFPEQQQQIRKGATARRPRLPRPVLGCLAIVVAVILCSGVSLFAADRLCYGALSQRLPLYPNAAVKQRVHNLFTEFGMGNTAITMTTPDDPTTVRNWYGARTGEYMREGLDSRSIGFTLARGQWDVTRDPDNPTGSQIILFGTCVQ
jgi:hypothetical protein